MNNLLALLRRSHRPDAQALSALVDGRLDPSRAQALQTHMAVCTLCAVRLDELRHVKTMLAAMPQTDAPRSFRLRQADVEVPARPAPVFLPGLLRAMPAASGVAALAFVLVLATDFSTRGDGGQMASIQGQSDRAMYAESIESKAAEAPAGAGAADGDDQSFDPASTQEFEPGLSDTGLAGTPEAGIARVDAPVEDATGGDSATAATGAIEQDSPPDGAADDAALTQVADEQVVGTTEAIVSEAYDDNGGRTAFLAVEIIAAGIAIAAGAAYAVSRGKRRVQS